MIEIRFSKVWDLSWLFWGFFLRDGVGAWFEIPRIFVFRRHLFEPLVAFLKFSTRFFRFLFWAGVFSALVVFFASFFPPFPRRKFWEGTFWPGLGFPPTWIWSSFSFRLRRIFCFSLRSKTSVSSCLKFQRYLFPFLGCLLQGLLEF